MVRRESGTGYEQVDHEVAGIGIDLWVGGGETNKKDKARGEQDVVCEEDPEGGHGEAERGKDVGDFLFMIIEAFGDELPELPNDPRGGEDECGDEGDFDVDGHEAGGGIGGDDFRGVPESNLGLDEWEEDPSDDGSAVVAGDEQDNDDADDGSDEV